MTERVGDQAGYSQTDILLEKSSTTEAFIIQLYESFLPIATHRINFK